VTLAGGAATPFGDPSSFFRRPDLAPGGARVVAERWINGSSDLWLVDVP